MATRSHALNILKLGAAFAALSATPALAQPPQETRTPPAEEAESPTSSVADPEIIVTARRRAESLLNVPIAITAYTAEQLEQQGALDITDISQTTPNVTLEASRGTNSTLTAFIRGVGQQDPVAGLDIYDVERIVLRP